MRIQIRQSVFETNSSSTHSLQLSQSNIESVTEDIFNRIKKQYQNFSDSNYFDQDTFIDGKTFYLKGFHIEDGDEMANVYYIIKSWMAKIQYMAMFIYSHIYYFDDYDKEASNNRFYNADNKDLAEKTAVCKWFKDEVKKYAGLHNIEIDEVIFDIGYDTYIEKTEGFNIEHLTDYKNINLNDIKNVFNNIMKDDYILTYMDEAYRPYYRPQIEVI